MSRSSDRIYIQLKAGINNQNTDIEYGGANVEVINDMERQNYGLGDECIKDAVMSLCGGRPQDVFVRSPTPWDDLYARYSWPQVQRTLYPVSAKIIGIRSEPVIVATREFINNSSVKATCNTGITQSIEHTVSNTWSTNSTRTWGQEVSYKLVFGVGEVGGTTSWSFTNAWGEESTKTKSVTVGSSSGVSMELAPGQSVTASLTASRGTVEIEVEYRATLNGVVACNYPGRYNGHHFWQHDINRVLDAVGKEKVKTSKEVITIDFYTNSKVILQDQHK